MEQSENAVNIQPTVRPTNTKLPIMTMIAAIWLMITGLSGIAFLIAGITIPLFGASDIEEGIAIFILLVGGIAFCIFFVIIPGILLCLKKKAARIIATMILLSGLLLSLCLLIFNWFLFSISFVALAVPLILLILDSKTNWKITSNRLFKANVMTSGRDN
jgi:O-antigen/teichoic acid export membrane protein